MLSIIDKKLSSNKKKFYVLFVLVSFVCFQFNFLNIAGTKSFYEIPPTNTEIEVTDGILHGKKTGEFVLGLYDRKGTQSRSENPTLYRLQFKNNDSNWEFKKYKTSFGIQVKLYGFLNKYFNMNLRMLNAFNSIIFSLVILSLIINLSKNFSFLASCAFGICISLSPWNIAFANELRFIEWTWFLPILAIIFIESINRISENKKILVLNLSVFILIMFKCLICYEFLSTVMAMSFVIYLFFVLKNTQVVRRIFYKIFLFSCSMLMGFILALIINIFSISDTYQKGVQFVSDRIFINLGLVDKENFNQIYCQDESSRGISLGEIKKRSLEEVEECKKQSEVFLSVSRFEVLLRYFVFRNFIPWIGNIEIFVQDDFKEYLRDIWLNKNYYKIKFVFKEYSLVDILPLFVILLNTPLFLFFILCCVVSVLKNPKDLRNLIIFGSFLASISWFLLAKKHAFIHMHLCYVVWTMSFIPFSTLVLIDKKINN